MSQQITDPEQVAAFRAAGVIWRVDREKFTVERIERERTAALFGQHTLERRFGHDLFLTEQRAIEELEAETLAAIALDTRERTNTLEKVRRLEVAIADAATALAVTRARLERMKRESSG